MNGETEFAAGLIERFTAYHRRSYVCKTGLGDVPIGAAPHESHRTEAGNYQPDDLLANVCKHNVTRFPYELARLAQDPAGGLVATLRLIENMTPGRNAVGYLTESKLTEKQDLAKNLAGIE